MGISRHTSRQRGLAIPEKIDPPLGLVLASLRCTSVCHGTCLYWLLTFYPPLMTIPDLLSGHVQPQPASKPTHPYGSWGACCFYKRCLNIWIIKFFPHYMRETNLGPERRVRRSPFHFHSGSSTKTQPKRQNTVLNTEATELPKASQQQIIHYMHQILSGWR